MKFKWIFGFLNVPAAFFIIIYSYLHFSLWYGISFFENEPTEVFDFIVVGGGSAGAVVASRLATNFSVLLLEEGVYAPSLASIPLISGVLPLTPISWRIPTESQKFGFDAALEKRSNWLGGKVLGGTSTLNFLLYVRGNRLDYDKWAEMGNYGWSYEDVLPFFKRSENYITGRVDDKYHGRDGEMYIENRAWKSDLPQAFLEAGAQLGFDETDVNGANQTGFAIPQVTTHFGARWDSYSAFLKNAEAKTNLRILTNAQVEKVLLDESNGAVGVQYKRFGHVFTASANAEVILSAGAIGSPKILMLSGIGPKEHLEALGIDVKANLRVGENLQDHVYVPFGPLLHNDSSASLVNPLDVTAWWSYLFHGSGQYSSNGIDGIAFKATKFSDNKDWPDIQIHFLPYSAASDHGLCVRKVLGMEDKLWDELYYPLIHHDTASLFTTLVRPKSRGWLKLRSSDPTDPPIVDPQYYSHPDDLRVMLEGLKFAKEIIESPAMKKYITMHNLRHPYCKRYELHSDDYLECLARHTTATLYHPAGTCKMGPKTDPNAVVDPSLRVYGIKGLRVADASIMPFIPNGNTHAPVVMIGEKAAAIILESRSIAKRDNHSDELDLTARKQEKEL